MYTQRASHRSASSVSSVWKLPNFPSQRQQKTDVFHATFCSEVLKMTVVFKTLGRMSFESIKGIF